MKKRKEDDTLYLIKELETTALNSVSDTLSLCTSFRQCYKETDAMLPVCVNPLVDAHLNVKLKETAHSRILYSLLTESDILKVHFLHYFLGKDVTAKDTTIPYPDKNRIDLTIKGKDFYLIIENKVNGASEQEEQVNRYVGIAKKTYPIEQIYVLYLTKDENKIPSAYSFSKENRRELGENFICKNYKTDILRWLYAVNDVISFEDEPQLKSTIVVYIGYLEDYFKTSKRQIIIMNSKLDKLIAEQLQLDNKSTSDKLIAIEDEIANMEKLQERLEALKEQYQKEKNEENFKAWYKECVDGIDKGITLTCESSTEFGFDFEFRNSTFRCEVSLDVKAYFWGIRQLSGRKTNRNTEDLANIVLKSKYGFHNNEENTPDWIVADYASEEEIVDRYVTLASIIKRNKECVIRKD